MKEQLANTVQEVLNGNFNPLEAYQFLKEINEFSKTCMEEVYDAAFTEAEKWKGQNFNGYLIEITKGRTTYDYSNCRQWNFKKQELKNLENELKNKLLNTDGFSEDTGEVFEDLPTVKNSKDTIKLKKIK